MSKFDYCSFIGGDDSFAVSKEKYSKEEAIDIAKQECISSYTKEKYLAISDAFVKHRAGINEQNEPCVGWWIEYEDTGRNCPVFIFRLANDKHLKGYEYILLHEGDYL
jgi:hypothetical protein